MTKTKQAFLFLSICILALALCAAGLAVFANPIGDAAAQTAGSPDDPGGPMSAADHSGSHDPFSPYPAAHDAIAYDDLEPAERARIDRAAEWAEADHGAEVHRRFSAASHQAAQRAALHLATTQSGLSGIDELGVK